MSTSVNVIHQRITLGGLGIGSIISNDYIWRVILDQSQVHGDK